MRFFFTKNIAWTRFKYTCTSVEGVIWIFYTCMFAWAGTAQPAADQAVAKASASTLLGTIYMTLGMLAWLNVESVKQISRIMHMTITFSIVLTITLTAYLSAYIWQVSYPSARQPFVTSG